jgi:hypothetical protein
MELPLSAGEMVAALDDEHERLMPLVSMEVGTGEWAA